MENTLPVVFKLDCNSPQKDLRRHDRRPFKLRIVVADKSGIVDGEIYDLSLCGCGLRLKHRFVLGQYLWLKIYPEQGRTTPVCDLVRVKWVADDRAGVEFLCVALESLQRFHRLFGDHTTLVLED
jgi:hypothetical protein